MITKPLTAREIIDDASLTDFASARRPLEPLPGVEPACCCSARPVVTVVMPSASSDTGYADILLCGHYYRAASYAALDPADACVFDAHGHRLLPREVSECRPE